MEVALLSSFMFQTQNVRISKQPERTWRRYLSKRSNLFSLDPKGPDSMVRCLPVGFRSI